MTNLIRQANVEEEKTSLTAFLSRYLSADADSARYEWLYLKNPGGRARAWLAFESATGQTIGVGAAFPRQISYLGNEVQGFVLGDFCIHPDHRSLGPAVALQRKCLEELSEEGTGPIFDFPSTSMLAIYKRLRIEASGNMVRFAKPLRVNRLVDQRISNRMVAGTVAAVANAGLRLRDAASRTASTWVIEEQTAPCGEEFTYAARKWGRKMGICVLRTAEYLNWRYLQHPLRRYHLWTARKDDRLCGYLVFHVEADDAAVADLFAEEDAVREALLSEAVTQARHHNARTLSFPFLSSQPGRKLLENCGFRPREASPVVLLAAHCKSAVPGNDEAGAWYLTHGDRES